MNAPSFCSDGVDRQRAREREQQRDRVLGHVRALDALQVRDEDAALGDGRDRRAAIGARVQQLNPFETRAARDDLGRAEADQHVGARDDLGHAGVVAQALHADDLDAGRDACADVSASGTSATTIFLGGCPAGALAHGRGAFAQLEALDELGRG